MLVVTDASPLIFLGRLSLLELLPQLYGRVLVPRTVLDEVVRGAPTDPAASALLSAAWLEVEEAGEAPLLEALHEELDSGEAAAIALARELGADLLLIDERQGRRIARRLGLAVKGTLGVLIAARNQDLVPELRPLLVRLSEEGAWLSDDLMNEALMAVGEETSTAG